MPGARWAPAYAVRLTSEGKDAELAMRYLESDLLQTAPPLLYIVKDSLEREIPYELKGEFGLDIPATTPLRFRSSGAVRFSEFSRQALKLR